MFLFLLLGRHSRSIIATLPEIDSASLSFQPITIDRHGQWIDIGSQVKYLRHPCFIFVSVMSSIQSIHSSYCNLPSYIQLWHLYFHILMVLVKKPISWYFQSKFHILKFNIHKSDLSGIFFENIFFGWISVLRQCYILTAIIEQNSCPLRGWCLPTISSSLDTFTSTSGNLKKYLACFIIMV